MLTIIWMSGSFCLSFELHTQIKSTVTKQICSIIHGAILVFTVNLSHTVIIITIIIITAIIKIPSEVYLDTLK